MGGISRFLIVTLFFTTYFNCFTAITTVPLDRVSGPESLAFDCEGHGPYVGVSDGSILRWEGANHGWTQFAVSSRHRSSELCDGSNDPSLESRCGRPLGLEFNRKTCELYIADSTFGLLAVGSKGGFATQVATSAAGIPFIFANGLDIDQSTGIVYFTDSSTRYHRSEYATAILSGDKTGRLIRYDPSTKTVTVLLTDLAFPNGVAVNRDGTFVLVTETGTGRVLRYWLKGSKAKTSDVFIQLPGQPDNIKMNARGEFWVAVNPFEAGLRAMPPPQMWSITGSQAMKLNEKGVVMEVFLGDDRSRLGSVSEAQESNGNLWIGSVVSSYLSVYRI